MKINDKTLEVIKVISLVIIAISSVFIAIWLCQIIQALDDIGGNLDRISNRLVDLYNKE
ncbi:MAG TPA: replication/maintenance protein RepL [Bacillus sp. (in: firmicutes)]|uniref:replication/maintenance protein RepL n=1 Tax=Bacillus litorisediminis TaxID=2922713 RepID=UPI001FAF269D|nr:replication/maintenance protein RepL [Bacillus litorisediminis]HWO76555.1 replication/maintenance protein RepL [Bacillus sp. (in: firmicutes)]